MKLNFIRFGSPLLFLMCLPALAQSTDGPGCKIDPTAPSVGADIPLAYFGPTPSTVDKRYVGPLQLLTAGVLDKSAGTLTLPLYKGAMKDGRLVWYILTDTTDEGNATALGLNYSPKLNYASTGRGVRTATLTKGGILIFDQGTVDFKPERKVIPGTGSKPFPPLTADPGSVGDNLYSPLVKIVNSGGHVYNAPMIAFDVTADKISFPKGTPNYALVHDSVVKIDPAAGTVTLSLAAGFSFGKPVLYLSLDASIPLAAALEGATYAPGLEDINTGGDDGAFSAVERLFLTINGPRGCENPQRQGIESALLDGRRPLNVLGGIPFVSTDYSPLWDVNMGAWTDDAIAKGYRSRLIDEFQILGMVQGGFITGPNGSKYGSAGFIVNCPIVFKFL